MELGGNVWLYFYSAVAQSFAALIALSMVFWTGFVEKQNQFILHLMYKIIEKVQQNIRFYNIILKPSDFNTFHEDIDTLIKLCDKGNYEIGMNYLTSINNIVKNNILSDSPERISIYPDKIKFLEEYRRFYENYASKIKSLNIQITYISKIKSLVQTMNIFYFIIMTISFFMLTQLYFYKNSDKAWLVVSLLFLICIIWGLLFLLILGLLILRGPHKLISNKILQFFLLWEKREKLL
jgi:hypothetical protein